MKKTTLSYSVLLVAAVLCFSYRSYSQCIYVIGGGGPGGYVNGKPATYASLVGPQALAVDDSGNVYMASSQQCIQKISKAGIITTVAGNGSGVRGFSGDGGPALLAKFNNPWGIAVDHKGNIFVADQGNYRIREIFAATGKINTVAGNGTKGFSGDGGPATSAKIYNAWSAGIAVDDSDNLYIVDNDNNRIRKVYATTHIITTIAGNGTSGYSGDGGPATSAQLQYPNGVAIDKLGNVFIADWGNSVIREVTASNDTINTIVGTGSFGYSGDGGPAISAQLSYPFDVKFDGAGNMYINDQFNGVIRKVDAITGNISSIAGGGPHTDSIGGLPADSTHFAFNMGIAVDSIGDVFMADSINYLVTELKNSAPAMPAFSGPSSLTTCSGDSESLTAYGTCMLEWYSASVGGTYLGKGNFFDTHALSAGTKTYYVQDSSWCGVSARNALTITVNPSPTVTISGDSAMCLGADMLTANITSGTSPFTYSWNTAGTNDTIQVASVKSFANKYNVTVKDADGCTSKNSFTVYRDSMPSISICMVSVDTGSTHNVIVWNKAGLTNIDSFKIYYFDAANHWFFLGAVPFNGNNYYVDSASINNPNANTVRYCLTALDSCGKEEHFTSSPWQNTSHIINSGGGTFSWSGTSYLKQGVTFPVLTYYLMRDSVSNGNWRVIDSTSGTQNTMTDVSYASFPKARWRVDAKLNDSISGGCSVPELRPVKAKTYNTSHSNTANIIVTGIPNPILNTNSISVFPNPAKELLNVKFNNVKAGMADMQIMDITGRIITEMQAEVSAGSITSLNIEGLSIGIYFIKVITSNSSQVIKLIKE